MDEIEIPVSVVGEEIAKAQLESVTRSVRNLRNEVGLLNMEMERLEVNFNRLGRKFRDAKKAVRGGKA